MSTRHHAHPALPLSPPHHPQQQQQQQQPPAQAPAAPQVPAAQRTAEARAAFTASLHSAASALDSDLQSRARNIHANARALQAQERDVEREMAGLRRWNDEMEGTVRGWRAEWEREVGQGILLDGGGRRLPRVVDKDRHTDRDRDRDRVGRHPNGKEEEEEEDGKEEPGEEELGLADLERELDVLDEWVRIVEDEHEHEHEHEREREESVPD